MIGKSILPDPSRAGRDDVYLYHQIIAELQQYAEVLTEHIGAASLTSFGENVTSDSSIHDRDTNWLFESDIIVTEVTHPSLGVGYELGRELRPQEGKRLSAMISGASTIEVFEYTSFEQLQVFFSSYFQK